MNATKLRRTLKSGGHVFGCMLSQMASTRFEQVLAGSTLDYAIIDSEHGSRDRTEIQSLCAMLRHADITPVVRVPIPKAEYVAMALDAGTAGVLVPILRNGGRSAGGRRHGEMAPAEGRIPAPRGGRQRAAQPGNEEIT